MGGRLGELGQEDALPREGAELEAGGRVDPGGPRRSGDGGRGDGRSGDGGRGPAVAHQHEDDRDERGGETRGGGRRRHGAGQRGGGRTGEPREREGEEQGVPRDRPAAHPRLAEAAEALAVDRLRCPGGAHRDDQEHGEDEGGGREGDAVGGSGRQHDRRAEEDLAEREGTGEQRAPSEERRQPEDDEAVAEGRGPAELECAADHEDRARAPAGERRHCFEHASPSAPPPPVSTVAQGRAALLAAAANDGGQALREAVR
ncbi:hypothetical protein Q0F99_04185 [Rathayibacter oskolensis]|nr:hypothetical protein [Rathayibacter oskolensis]WKK73442.1 hypothetical protein Q0F99_04185 [Rathayibacter oskolensis]